MPGFNLGGSGNSQGPPNTLETSRANRYILEILEPLKQSILVNAHKCDRPSPEIDRITQHLGQDEIYWPGKNRWLPINISFYQAHNNAYDDTAERIYQWWAESVIDIKESVIATNFWRDGILFLLNGMGQKAWSYNIYGSWPSKVTPDTLDYASDKIAEIVVTLQMDKCKEKAETGGRKATSPSCPIQ